MRGCLDWRVELRFSQSEQWIEDAMSHVGAWGGCLLAAFEALKPSCGCAANKKPAGFRLAGFF